MAESLELKVLPSLEHLLFEAPLYALFRLPEGKWWKGDNLEGFCPYCRKESIFKVTWRPALRDPAPYRQPISAQVDCRCVRSETHVIRFLLYAENDTVQKWGQLPSFADVTEGSLKTYRGLIEPAVASELNRATRLAAHGVGIGSFVYMRRIFERLIHKRFEDLKHSQGWSEDNYKHMRMDERIDLMKEYLPDFMVKNKKLYAILSRGIHELTERECLAFFEVARTAIVFILADERRKKEELAERQEAQKAIASFGTS